MFSRLAASVASTFVILRPISNFARSKTSNLSPPSSTPIHPTSCTIRHLQFHRIMSTSPPKKSKSDIVIGTHDGMFHCDEALACFMLRQLPAYADATILRTRQTDQLDACDIVVDVGAVFDPATQRYDHHQRTFQDTLATLQPETAGAYSKVRLSSAGLVYAFYGKDVIRALLKANPKTSSMVVTDDQLQRIYLKVYDNLIQEIDGVDNGVPMFDGEPTYRISSGISSRVAGLNEQWNATAEEKAAFDVNVQFQRAQEMVGAELVDRVLYYATSWWPARAIVVQAVRNRFQVHGSGEILELPEFCPWKEHLYVLEGEGEDGLVAGGPKLVFYMNRPDDWRVMGVPLNPKSFVGRKFLHRAWRGERNEKLQELSGVPDATFVHASGFIGGAKTRAGALQMAIGSLESVDEEAVEKVSDAQ